ncbi:MAG: hypothetical protein AB7U85_02865 [Alphaproteobacteria bacterium]
MKALKTLLLFMVFAVSGCDNETVEDNAVQKEGGVFEKLGYNPKWEEIPSVNEFKDVFLKTTGQSFDDKVNDCAYELINPKSDCEENSGCDIERELRKIEKTMLKRANQRFDDIINPSYLVKQYDPQSKISYFEDICYKSLFLELNYLEKGHKLACKRSDFFRNLIEDGSSWLLSNNYSKEVIDDWFGSQYLVPKKIKLDRIENTIYDPYVVRKKILKVSEDLLLYKDSKYASFCKAVAEGYGYLFYDKVDVDDKVKKIEKNTDIAQSNVKLKDKGEPDYIIEFDYDNDGKKELIHRTYLYGEPEKGKPENSPDYGDGVFLGATHCQRELQNYYDSSINRDILTVYKDNIGKVEKYLKKIKTIEGWDHLKSIREKFGGKDLDYECLYNIKKLKNADFFTFKHNPYIMYSDDYENKVISIKAKEYNVECYSLHLHSKLFEETDSRKQINIDYKALVAGSFPIYYVNDDVYFYDETLLDEIKKISYNVSWYDSDTRNKVEEYLKDKAKTICNVDLDKVQYKPENKAKILKLRKDNSEEAVLDEAKIVFNDDIPKEQKECGLNFEQDNCTLYILNNSNEGIKARYFLPMAAKETKNTQRELMYINDGYNDTVIEPGQFAQIDIPVPLFLSVHKKTWINKFF